MSLNANWNEIKGKVRQAWSKLTDDDMGRLQGNFEELTGVLQQRYGHTKEEAWKQVEDFKKKHLTQENKSEA